MTEQNNKDNIMRKIKQNMLDKLELVGVLVESASQRNLTENKSVISGNLRQSMNHKVIDNELSVRIGTAVVYAARVEFGFSAQDSLGRTYNQPAKPYLRPALLNNKSQINKIFDL